MTTQNQLLAQIDAMASAAMVPVGMMDTGDWCGRGGQSRTGITVVVDQDTQEIGSDGVSVSVGATEVELYEHEIGQKPKIGDTVRVGDTLYKLVRLIRRDGNAHRFEVST